MATSKRGGRIIPLLLKYFKGSKQFQLVVEKREYQSPIWHNGEAIIYYWDATEVWEETSLEGIKVRLRTAFEKFIASIEIAEEERAQDCSPQSDWKTRVKDARNQGTTTTFMSPNP